jgi:hypothetical protein
MKREQAGKVSLPHFFPLFFPEAKTTTDETEPESLTQQMTPRPSLTFNLPRSQGNGQAPTPLVVPTLSSHHLPLSSRINRLPISPLFVPLLPPLSLSLSPLRTATRQATST